MRFGAVRLDSAGFLAHDSTARVEILPLIMPAFLKWRHLKSGSIKKTPMRHRKEAVVGMISGIRLDCVRLPRQNVDSKADSE